MGIYFGFGIGKDANGGFLAGYFIGSTGIPENTHKYRITDFDINLLEHYMLIVEKTTKSSSYYTVTVTNNNGEMYQKTMLNTSSTTDTTNEASGSSIGYGWGYIRFYALVGAATYSNICYDVVAKKNDLKLALFGHSFIEGNSISQQKDKRFGYLLCNDIGLDNCVTCGRGGETISGLAARISNELKLIRNVNYVLVNIGGNDTDSSTNAEIMQDIEDSIVSIGAKSIWITNPIKKENGEFVNKSIINKYMTDNFNTVDIRPIFLLDDGETADESTFLSDGVHPTVDSHNLIYQLIKAKCPYLYCI